MFDSFLFLCTALSNESQNSFHFIFLLKMATYLALVTSEKTLRAFLFLFGVQGSRVALSLDYTSFCISFCKVTNSENSIFSLGLVSIFNLLRLSAILSYV